MRYFLLALTIALACKVKGQNDCPPFTADAQGKPVKVTFYTEANACFTLTADGSVINSSPSKRVVVYMNYGFLPCKIKLSNGVELERKVASNNTMASITMEITYNEKKDSWDIKNRLGQGEVTAEEQQKREDSANAMNQKMKDDQAARDKEWDEKRAAEKAEREKEKAESQPKYTIQQVDTKLSKPADPPAATAGESSNATAPAGNNNAGNTIATEEVKASVPEGYPYGYQIFYEKKPIRKTKFAFVSQDSKTEGQVLMSGTTDDQGLVVMYTTLPMGSYDARLIIEIDGQLKKTGPMLKVNIGNTSANAIIFEYDKYIAQYQSYSKECTSTIEANYGLDIAKKR